MYGDAMMNKPTAIEIKERSLSAVSELSQLLNAIKGRCSSEEYDRIKRGVGLSIGRIQTELLDIVYTAYPELDDLN